MPGGISWLAVHWVIGGLGADHQQGLGGQLLHKLAYLVVAVVAGVAGPFGPLVRASSKC